ncbi:MAG: phosphoribosylanthranilate isomerase [Ruminococcus sp.]
MTRIKICGLRRIEDIDYVNEFSPDYIGFVFAKKSKRYILPSVAKNLRKSLDASIIPVGVFVDEDMEEVVKILQSGCIDAVQLHGREDNSYIDLLKSCSDCTVIKAFKVKTEEDILLANESHADMVLLDSGEGSGEEFDHSLIEGINRPYFLAGGLSPYNVGFAIKNLRPFGVDASSSLEAYGFKYKDKIASFIDAVRKADKNND